MSTLKGRTQIPHLPLTSPALEKGAAGSAFCSLVGDDHKGESKLLSGPLHREHRERRSGPDSGARHRCTGSSPRRRSATAARLRPRASPRAAVQSGSANELTNVSQVLIMSGALEPKPLSLCPHLSLTQAQAGAVAQPLPAGCDRDHPGTARPERSPILSGRGELLASAAEQRVVRSGRPGGRRLRMLLDGGAGSPPGWHAAAAAQMCECR